MFLRCFALKIYPLDCFKKGAWLDLKIILNEEVLCPCIWITHIYLELTFFADYDEIYLKYLFLFYPMPKRSYTQKTQKNHDFGQVGSLAEVLCPCQSVTHVNFCLKM